MKLSNIFIAALLGGAVFLSSCGGDDNGSPSNADCDNSINQDQTACDNSPEISNLYSETVTGDSRSITTNRVPEHDYGNQLANMGVTGLVSNITNFNLPAEPTLASSSTDIVDNNNRPAYDFGIAVNGVPIDPAPAEPFIFENSSTGEFNWDWVFEPTNNVSEVGLDCNYAHLQPTSASNLGLIHYHGDMQVFADELLPGLGTGSTVPTSPVQVGWAADGYPILYKYGPDGAGGIAELTSSYVLRTGERPGDGISAPCGTYNGKYTADYVFTEGAGSLDACNGVERSITLTTRAGRSETFNYFYVVTEAFPIIPRCISGTPGNDFAKGGG